jgi:hypothetical protein
MKSIVIVVALIACSMQAQAASKQTLTANQKRAGCWFLSGTLECPSPGENRCWVKGGDPYKDQPARSVPVGNAKRCSRLEPEE